MIEDEQQCRRQFRMQPAAALEQRRVQRDHGRPAEDRRPHRRGADEAV